MTGCVHICVYVCIYLCVGVCAAAAKWVQIQKNKKREAIPKHTQNETGCFPLVVPASRQWYILIMVPLIYICFSFERNEL